MTTAYLGLGTNLGDRRANIEAALTELHSADLKIQNISPVYETPALLPESADPSWNMPFLNIVAQIETSLAPQEVLAITQNIEKKLGRLEHLRWSPRTIDIDILLWGSEIIKTADLEIPHPEIQKRAFVVFPLKDLAPQITHPVLKKTFLDLARSLQTPHPLLMGTLNTTPDSFSDGGRYLQPQTLDDFFKDLEDYNIPYLDVGAESTRPGAELQSPQNEWTRLEPVLQKFKTHFEGKWLRPKLSLDTRHTQTAEKALPFGLNIINDVSGFEDHKMSELILAHNLEYVLMHNLGIPANPQKVLARDANPIQEVTDWFEAKLEALQKQNVPLHKIILDPGIGFGKMALHSFQLLQNIESFHSFQNKILVGHSRKSFMNIYSKKHFSQRDYETLGVSFYLAHKNIDILRVHDMVMHKRSLLSYQHCF